MAPSDHDPTDPDPAGTMPAVRRERPREPGAEAEVGVRLEIVGGPMDGITAHAPGEVLVIGRSPDSDLCLHLDPLVSARHARVVRDGRGHWLEDLDSRNGTFIGGQRIQQRTLIGPGTQFVLGNTCLEFTPTGGAGGL